MIHLIFLNSIKVSSDQWYLERSTAWLFGNKNNLAMNERVDDDQERERRKIFLLDVCSLDARPAIHPMHSSLRANPYARSLLSIILLFFFLFVSSLYCSAYDPTFAIDKARHLQIFNLNPVQTSLWLLYLNNLFLMILIQIMLSSSRVLFLTMKTLMIFI